MIRCRSAARPRTPRWIVLGATLFALLVPFAGVSSAQAAGPEWNLTVTPNADYFIAGSDVGGYTIEAENVGNEPTTSAPIALEDTLPAGFSGEEVLLYDSGSGGEISSSPPTQSEYDLAGKDGLCPGILRCEYPGSQPPVAPGQRLVMVLRVAVPAGASGQILDRVRVSGGGAPAAKASATNEASGPEPPFGLLHFESTLTDSSAEPYTQAGGRPYQYLTEFNFATYSQPQFETPPAIYPVGFRWWEGGDEPVHDPRNVSSDLPPGLLANPQGVPHCSLADYFAEECPISTVVGYAGVRIFNLYNKTFSRIEPIFNLQPTGAYPGELGFPVADLPVGLITAGLRSGSDYGVTAATTSIAEVGLNRVRIDLWGVPAEESHDALRGKECNPTTGRFMNSIEVAVQECEAEFGLGSNGAGLHGGPAGVPPTPFLTMPTECSGEPLTIGGRYSTWQLAGQEAKAAVTVPAVDGCNQLNFAPSIEARPTTNLADAPSGFEFDLKVPQHEGVNEDATAELKEAVVRLPQGLTVNPSSGAGLEGCSPAQVGLTTPVATTPAHFTEAPAACPDASKLGTVEVKTQLLHNPLQGSVYLATPHQNPSGNLLAGYIVLEGEGIIIKLAGQFQTNPQTGQITASFLENPQTPFEEFKFHFFEGAQGALRTPAVCGTYETTSTLTPYSAPESGPPAEPGAEFETTAGPGGEGSPCPNAASEEPNKPIFHAGTESTQAGAYSPFSLKLVRESGEQEIKQIETTLPPGLVGKLAGVAECSEAQLAEAEHESGTQEQASPSCPAASEVGTVNVAAGAGPTPLNVGGHAYLAGPYKGAPLSLAIITPAVAGPFDLGDVVVKTALDVNPETTQITAKSDPIPTILEGIPLDVRSITLQMARPNFTLNPTNCEPLAITGSALSVFGASAPLTQRFQVGGCPALAFKPKLALSLKGSTKRAGNPALTATLTMPPGGANVASAQVTLPHSAFLDQSHIKTVCTRPQLASHSCPAASVYGKATAVTPLLEKPLSGPVYLGTGFGYKLPALVADLNGQIEVLLHGKVDTGREHGIRNTFEVVPDAPVTKFTLAMDGGKKSLIESSEDLCSPKAKDKALAKFTGQNGKTYEFEPTVANSCKKRAKSHRSHKRHKRHLLGGLHW